MKQTFKSVITIVTTLALISADAVICDSTSTARQAGARRLAQSGGSSVFKSPCGDADSASRKVGQCVQPLLGLIEGTVPDPKSDSDLAEVCDRFAASEKCVRAFAKDCLTGLHKAVVSSIASATKRYRTQECKTAQSRAKYAEPLRCANRKGNEMLLVNQNATAVVQAIRDLKITPEEKLVKTCCLLNWLDKEVEIRFNRDCPESTPLVLGIMHAMTDDARNTLCRNPKCNNVLTPQIMSNKYKPPQNLLEPLMQVVFTISTE